MAYDTIGDLLRDARERQNYSQEESVHLLPYQELKMGCRLQEKNFWKD